MVSTALTLEAVSRFFTPAWLVRHALAVVLSVGFVALGWWQLERATGGNGLSWAYTFEWPLFALFVIALWVREVRAELADASGRAAREAEPPLTSPFGGATTGRQVTRDASEATGDDDTDAYNRYLAWLSDNPDRRPDEYPG